MGKLVFASTNEGKIKEVCNIFSDTGITIIPMNELGSIPEIEEDGLTFEDNAFKKSKNCFSEIRIADYC